MVSNPIKLDALDRNLTRYRVDNNMMLKDVSAICNAQIISMIFEKLPLNDWNFAGLISALLQRIY